MQNQSNAIREVSSRRTYLCPWEDCEKAYEEKKFLRIHIQSHLKTETPVVSRSPSLSANINTFVPPSIQDSSYTFLQPPRTTIPPIRLDLSSPEPPKAPELSSVPLKFEKPVPPPPPPRPEPPKAVSSVPVALSPIVPVKAIPVPPPPPIRLIEDSSKEDLEDALYKCQWKDCGRSFRLLSHLNSYIKYHEAWTKPYFCITPQCGKRFKTLASLEVHRILHKNPAPPAASEGSETTEILPRNPKVTGYRCSCGKLYFRKPYFDRHIQQTNHEVYEGT